VDVRRISLIPRPLAVRRARHVKHTRRATKAGVLLFPTAVLSMALVSASQATGSEPGADFQLTSFNPPMHAAISSDAAVLVSRLAALAAAAPTPPPAPAIVVAPAPGVSAQPAVDTSSAAAWAASPGVACIRDHESGDNYAEDTGNGYYGAYQDLLSTWETHGGSGLPNDAPPAVQDQVNYQIFLTGGWGQWSTAPGCGL
jgi:Transglycosylase-like domain